MRRSGHRAGPSRRLRTALLAGCALLAAALALVGCGGERDRPGESPPSAFDADRAFADLRRQVELGPRESGSAAADRLARRLASTLEEAGVGEVEIQRPMKNVVGLIPGEGEGYVVLGAHYDTKGGIPRFEGANDGASGVATVLELARSLPNPMPGPSIAIALFDGEEARGERPFALDGMRGSRQYVELAAAPEEDRQGTPALEEIEAMVLLDMVGDCDLEIPRESNSDQALYAHFAARGDPEVFGGETIPISDDHIPFLEAGIHAVDLIDFAYGPGGSPGAWWHTPGDTLDKVCAESLGTVGTAVERGLLRLHELG